MQFKHWISVKEATELLGPGVTVQNVVGMTKRGTLHGVNDENGQLMIDKYHLDEVIENREKCDACRKPGSQFVIVKYHHHVRVEFVSCEDCVIEAVNGYSRKGGVLEVVYFPLLSEAWYR